MPKPTDTLKARGFRSLSRFMEIVTVSPKFQVVIPKSVRAALGIVAGQHVQAVVVDGRVELIPLRPMADLRGVLRGIDTSVVRDEDTR